MAGLYLDALKQIIRMLMPFVIIIIISTIIMYFYRKHKYGISFTDFLKKHQLNIDVDEEIMNLMLSKLTGKYEIIESDKLNAKFCVLCKSGLYLIETCNIHRGSLSGDLNSETLEWREDKNLNYISNPFLRQEKDIELLNNKFPNANVKGFVVFGNEVLLNLTYYGKSTIIRSKNIVYKLQEMINLEEEDINKEEIKLFLK